MPPSPVPADPGWDEDLAWLDRDPMAAAERQASLDRLCEQDEGYREEDGEDFEPFTVEELAEIREAAADELLAVKAVAATFAAVPGGSRGYQVLAAAARDEHGSQLALAQHLGVDRTVMTYLLDSLAEAGLIERRPDPADRRARRIVATARGRSRLDGLGERLREAEDQVLAGLAEAEDRQAFRALLQRLALHAATTLDSAAPDPCSEPVPGSC